MLFRNSRFCIAGGLVLIAFLNAGCGPSRPPTASVSGIVTLDGQPVANAEVMFVPQAGGRPASALTHADGSFQLSTFEASDHADGALLGEHRVAIAKAVRTAAPVDTQDPNTMISPGSSERIQVKHLLPAMYCSIDTSNLAATVKPGRNQLRFDLVSQ